MGKMGKTNGGRAGEMSGGSGAGKGVKREAEEPVTKTLARGEGRKPGDGADLGEERGLSIRAPGP